MKKILSLILIVTLAAFFFPKTTYAVATVTLATGQTTTTDSFTTGRTSNTFSCTVPALGTDQNRAVWVVAMDNHTAMLTGTTFDGVAMTAVVNIAAAQNDRIIVYFLANPSAGTFNVVETYSESRSDGTSYCFTTQDTAQSSPIDGTVHGSDSSGTSLTDSITPTLNGAMIVDAANIGHAASNLAVVAGQTALGTNVNTNHNNWISYNTQVTAGAISMGWTWTTSVIFDHYVWAVKYLAPTVAASGGGGARYIPID